MKTVIAFILTLQLVPTVYATHIRGGQITVIVLNGNTCQITLRGFAFEASAVKWEGGTLDFGDGSTSVVAPGVPFYISTIDPAIGIYSYTVNHTYPGPGFYTVSYFERNLDIGILNMDNSIDTPFSITSGFTLDPLLKYSSIQFPDDPIFQTCLGQSFSFSTAPIDTSYLYAYEVIRPDAINYSIPENFSVNSQTGLVTWDTKFHGAYSAGKYFFSIRVNQYDRKKRYLGYVIRSFELVVSNFDSRLSISNPISDPIGKIVVKPTQQKTLKLFLSDTSSVDSLKWLPHFDSSLSEYISFTQYDSSTAKSKIKVGVFSFESVDKIARDQPYTIVFRGYSFGQDFPYAAGDVSYLLFTKDVEFPIITESISNEGEIRFFPNPCKDELNISGLQNSVNVQVFNNLGNPEMTMEIDSAHNNKINTSLLLPGIYIIRLQGESIRAQYKFVKR